MTEALHEIKTHLGPEALLLSTKEIPSRSGVRGSSAGFEVVAASDDSNGLAFSPSSQDAFFESDTSLWREVAATPSEKEFRFKGEMSVGLYKDLIACGVSEWLAERILTQTLTNITDGERLSRNELIQSMTQVAQTLVAAPSTQNGMPGKKVVVFVGPTGAGKTTSIAKLASQLALRSNKKIILMTLDGCRIGAVEQLRTYAGLIGVPFRYVSQSVDLNRVVEENRHRDYILVDTAGCGPRDSEAMRDRASVLNQLKNIECHLVISATTNPLDIGKIVDGFEIYNPDHLLFTKLDETSILGPILNEFVRTQKSFSYYTNGQRVPDDLHTVPRENILDFVLRAQ